MRRVFNFYCSLGGYRDDLDLLLRVYSGLVSALGIQGSPYPNLNWNCQGTWFSLSVRGCDRPAELVPVS